MLVLDDLHWSDGASIELIAALLRRGPAAPVLLALAFRPGQAPAAAGRRAGRRRALARLELGAAERERGGRQLLGGLDAAAVAAIYRHGGGNPFYLEQLGRGARRRRLSAAREDAGGDRTACPPRWRPRSPRSWRALARRRARLLEAAAVAGEPFEPGPRRRDRRALDARRRSTRSTSCSTLDLVRPTQVPRRFVFRHPLVRRAVYESVARRLAAGRARAAAEALAARGAGAAERAHHVEQLGGPGRRGGDRAAARGRRCRRGARAAAAARWFEAALRLLPSDDASAQVSVRVALASALRSLGELERCRSTLLEAIELLPRRRRGAPRAS